MVLGLAVLALAAALAPGAAVASTSHSHPGIVCPEAVTPGCCGPITAVRSEQTPCCPANTTVACCTPVAGSTCCATSPCPSSLSIDISPNPAIEGKQATISGTLSGGTSDASQTVQLWEKPAGETAFSDVASTQTNASGAFSFMRTVTTNAQWYVKYASVTSSTVTESVLAAAVLHPSRAGAKLKLAGTIAPSHAGERVTLQELRGARWVTIARPKLTANSRFSFTRKMTGHSLERFRIVLAADARNARSVSSVVAVRV